MSNENFKKIRVVKKNAEGTKIFFNNHNSRFYSNYRADALELIDGDFSEKNLEKTRTTILDRYKELNPFDETPVIDGINPEAREMFIESKVKVNRELHKLLINEVFDDIISGEEIVLRDKTATIHLDRKDIISQIKYLEAVLSSIEEKMVGGITKHLLKNKGKYGSDVVDTVLYIASDIKEDLKHNFHQGRSNTYVIVKKHLDNLLEKTQGTSSSKEIESRVKLCMNYVKNNIGKNKIEHIIKQTRDELSKFNSHNPQPHEVIGLSTYTDQISKFISVLDNENVKISTNFFNVRRDLFHNAFTFLYGWAMENITFERMKSLQEYEGKSVKFVEPTDWDRIAHYHAISKMYFYEKIIGLDNQIKSYHHSTEKTFVIEGEEISKKDILQNLSECKELVEFIDTSIKDDIRALYIEGSDSLSSDLRDLIDKYDSQLHENDTFKKAPSLFFDNKFKDSNQKNHNKTYKSTGAKLNKIFKFNALNPDVSLNNYDQKMLKHYNNNRNLPMVDVFVYEGDKILEIHEIKTLSNKTGDLILPLNFSHNTRSGKLMEEIFEIENIEYTYMKHGKERTGYNQKYTFRKDNIEFMKQNSELIFDKQSSKENKIADLGFDTDTLYYAFNIINEIKGVSSLYKIPLQQYHELFFRDDFFDNVEFGKRNGYKFFYKINSDYFESVFKEYKIAPTNDIKSLKAPSPR